MFAGAGTTFAAPAGGGAALAGAAASSAPVTAIAIVNLVVLGMPMAMSSLSTGSLEARTVPSFDGNQSAESAI